MIYLLLITSLQIRHDPSVLMSAPAPSTVSVRESTRAHYMAPSAYPYLHIIRGQSRVSLCVLALPVKLVMPL